MSGSALVLIGGGNMGAALLTGLITRGTVEPDDVAIVEIAAERRKWLETQFPDVAVHDEIPPCEAAVVATKPAGACDAAAAAAQAGARRVLSIAAGVTTSNLDAAVGESVAVVRAMPNIAALVGRAASAITPGQAATDADLAWAESVLGAVGRVDRLDEASFDAFTALAGSGPAYLFAVAEHLAAAGAAAGLPPALCSGVVRELFAGAARMLDDGGNPEQLRAMVTSPGGTTAAGISALDEHDVGAAFADAVAAAATRSRELG